MLFFDDYISPLGSIYLSSDGVNLTGLQFELEALCAPQVFYKQKNPLLPLFCDVKEFLNSYFSRIEASINFSIAVKASQFQESVWQCARRIPWGCTRSYKQLADEINPQSPQLARAVGAALAKNPILIIIPCHRVLNVKGELHGFAAGLEIKSKLLQIEGAAFKQPPTSKNLSR